MVGEIFIKKVSSLHPKILTLHSLRIELWPKLVENENNLLFHLLIQERL